MSWQLDGPFTLKIDLNVASVWLIGCFLFLLHKNWILTGLFIYLFWNFLITEGDAETKTAG